MVRAGDRRCRRAKVGACARPGLDIAPHPDADPKLTQPLGGAVRLILIPAAMNWAPALALYLAVISVLGQLLRSARTGGPFAVTVARRLRFLGWLVLAGSVIGTAGQSLAQGALIGTIITGPVPAARNAAEAGLTVILVPLAAGLRAADPGPGDPRRGRPARRPRGHRVTPAGHDPEHAIGVHLDDLLAARGLTLTELSARVGVTIVQLHLGRNAGQHPRHTAPAPSTCSRRPARPARACSDNAAGRSKLEQSAIADP
jgi:hypothetical protein